MSIEPGAAKDREAFRILSIDGGGIRGVIPAIFLSKISEMLGGGQLHEHFDLVAGTSTGAIIASSVALGYPVDECLNLYKEFGPEIFPTVGPPERTWKDYFRLSPAYDDKPLANALQKLFSKNAKLQDAKTNLFISSYDVLNREVFLMNSYDENHKEIPVWEACKASCSAPTYFPAHVLNISKIDRPLVDGGVFCNNPSLIALAEAIKLRNKQGIREFQKKNRIFMISLGTGSLRRKISIQQSREWGAIRWVKPLIDVMFDGSSEAAHIGTKQIISPNNYVRWQIELDTVNDDLDDASVENILALENAARTFLESEDGKERQEQMKAFIKRSK